MDYRGILASISIGSALLLGCSGHSNDLKTDTGTFAEGQRLMDRGFQEEARTQFYRIKTEFPESSLQVQAALKIADSYFDEESFSAAATSYSDFIKTYPGRPEIPDALFKLGLSYAKQMPTTEQRDARATNQALDVFTRLLAEYPNFEKREEAQKWIDAGQNQLAAKSFSVGRFYEKSGQYDSAAKRYEEVINRYGFLAIAEEAWARMIRCLRKSDQNERAENFKRDFDQKYPASEFRSITEP